MGNILSRREIETLCWTGSCVRNGMDVGKSQLSLPGALQQRLSWFPFQDLFDQVILKCVTC